MCLSARCKIDTHTELNSSKRQAAAETSKIFKYADYNTSFRTLLYFYLLLFHKHTRSFSSFLIYNTIIFHTFFRSFSLSLYLSLLFSDRNHITKFTNITHSQKNEPCLTRIVAYKRRKIVANSATD